MAEIYYGRSMQNALQTIAHDLGGMQTMLNLAIGPNDQTVRRGCVHGVTFRAQDFINLADYPMTNNHDTDIPGSELLNPANFSANPVAGPPAPA